MPDTLGVLWQERTVPLTPIAAAGIGRVGVRLARRLLAESDDTLQPLRAAGGTAVCLLLLLADTPEQLPWVDGILYLGRDPDAPSLLLPTNRIPDAPLPLVERALRARFPELPPPLAILPGAPLLRAFSATAARPVSRRVLSAWASAWEAALSRKNGDTA